jgi:hypothetical protein
MQTIAVLFLTIFMSNGAVTARAIVAPSMEDCEAAKPFIVAQLVQQRVKMIEGENATVKFVDGICHQSTEGSNA